MTGPGEGKNSTQPTKLAVYRGEGCAGTSSALRLIGDLGIEDLANYVVENARRSRLSRRDYLSLDKDARARVKDGPYLSFARYKDDAPHRRNEDCTAVTALVVDFDQHPDPWGAVSRIEENGYGFVAHATASDDPDGDRRVRLIIPLATPGRPADYQNAYALAVQALGLGEADPAAAKPTQAWFLPVVFEGEAGAIVKSSEGIPLDLMPLIPKAKAPPGTSPQPGLGIPDDAQKIEQILRAEGWREGKPYRSGKMWTRPGKLGGCSGSTFVSGTTGDALFQVWTTSTVLEPKTYDLVGIAAALYHNGDRMAAWRSLMDAAGKRHLCQIPTGGLGAPSEPIDAVLPPPGIRPPRKGVAQVRDAARGAGIRLWQSGNTAFASVPRKDGGWDNCKIGKGQFRHSVMAAVMDRAPTTPGREAIDGAIDQMEAEALHRCPEFETALRVAHAGGEIWLDLCDQARRAVRITAQGWTIEDADRCPVKFLRPPNAASLPEPSRDGSFCALPDLLNLDPEGLTLVVGFWLGCLKPPRGLYPILVASGEQGSAKTTGSKIIHRMIDPCEADLRSGLPKDDRDLRTALYNGFLPAYDNLSSIPGWLSNAFCSVTGGTALTSRQLYSDTEEAMVKAHRPIMLNGIGELAERPDLADRTMSLEFRRIPEERRKTEDEVWTAFDRAQPFILGAILDLVSVGLAVRGTVIVGRLPRMADFVRWVCECSPDDGAAFRACFSRNRREQTELLAQNDPVLVGILELLKRGPIYATAASLLEQLNEGNERGRRSKGWPSTPGAMGRRLKHVAPVLLELGCSAEWSRTGQGRWWQISSAGDGSSGVAVGDGAASPPNCPYLNLDSNGRDGNDGCDGTIGNLIPDVQHSHGERPAADADPFDEE